MKTLSFSSREEWLSARSGRITGTVLKEVVSAEGPTKEMIIKALTDQGIEFKKSDKKEVLEMLIPADIMVALTKQLPKKIGFYQLIADRLGIGAGDEDPMERGQRLEKEAVAKFSEETGKEVDTSLVMWIRDDNENIAISPDGFIGKTEAVEVKCLSSARHIEALLTQKVPSDYEMQILQYFVVSDKLQTVFMVFYDPRLLAKPFFYLTITREEMQEKVDEYLEYERGILKEVEDAVLQISF